MKNHCILTGALCLLALALLAGCEPKAEDATTVSHNTKIKSSAPTTGATSGAGGPSSPPPGAPPPGPAGVPGAPAGGTVKKGHPTLND
jgi:hypothetical protein